MIYISKCALLIFLLFATSLTALANSSDLPGIPQGWKITSRINADFDGDAHDEIAYVIVGKKPFESGPAPVVCISKGRKLIWQQKCQFPLLDDPWSADEVKDMRAIDLTGDGHPELIFDALLLGASDNSIRFYAYRFAKGTFVSMLSTSNGIFSSIVGGKGGCFEHQLQGGVIVSRKSSRSKTRSLCFGAMGKFVDEKYCSCTNHRPKSVDTVCVSAVASSTSDDKLTITAGGPAQPRPHQTTCNVRSQTLASANASSCPPVDTPTKGHTCLLSANLIYSMVCKTLNFTANSWVSNTLGL